MNTKKQVFLSLETAKQMWKAECELQHVTKTTTQLFLLDNYTKEELEAEELPKTYLELKTIYGYKINREARISELIQTNHSHYDNRNVWPTKELAKAALALSQLCQLRDVYNDDWKPDLNNRPNERIYFIRNCNNQIDKLEGSMYGFNVILSFKLESIRNEFLKNFEDLIKTALPLL